MKKLYTILICTFFGLSISFGQSINTTETDIEYYVNEVLLGNLITASNITFTGNLGGENSSIGEFNEYGGTVLDLESGVVISNGYVSSISNTSSFNASGALSSGGDSDLDILANVNTQDVTIIEFDYIPNTNAVNFKYVFASEEFPEYVNSYNDAFGFFVSGPGIEGPYSNQAINIATLPNSDVAVCINSVFDTEYYIENQSEDPFVFDGLITPMDATVSLIPFETYHIKIIVGDASDNIFDTGVFLNDNSFESLPIAFNVTSTEVGDFEETTATENESYITIEMSLPAPAIDNISFPFEISGTAENGVDYYILDESVSFAEGSQNSYINIYPLADNEVEGNETIELVFDYLDETISVIIQDNLNGQNIGISTTDSLGLVSMYNNTNGSDWSNNSNWLEANVTEWYGIETFSDRVIGINLSGNNLVGSIPSEFSQLTLLSELNVTFNYLTEISEDLANLENLTKLYINHNNLDFSSIEPFVSIQDFSYDGQFFEGETINVELLEGESYSYEVIVGGEHNTYQWIKGGDILEGQNSSELSLSNIMITDGGTYRCLISNEVATELTLESQAIVIVVDPMDVEISPGVTAEIYPNPARNILNIDCGKQINSVDIFDSNGTLVKTINGNHSGIDISELPMGIYFIRITTKESQITRRLIVN